MNKLNQLKIPVVSQAGVQVLDALGTPDGVSLLTLANLIGKDPNLSATVVRYANSPLYRRMVETTNVRNAVSILGIKNVRLAVVVASMRALHADLTPDMQSMLEHCTGVAVVARTIALYSSPFLADDIELTALVHDLGGLVLAANYPKEYRLVTERVAADPATRVIDVEREVLGMDRAQAMAVMSETFRLPEVVVDAVKRFFDRQPLTRLETPTDRHVAVLHFAHALQCGRLNACACLNRELPLNSPDEWQALLGLTAEQMEKIHHRIAEDVSRP